MMNYNRIFIKNLTELAHPLYKLLIKEEEFKWSNEQEIAFIVLKKQ